MRTGFGLASRVTSFIIPDITRLGDFQWAFQIDTEYIQDLMYQDESDIRFQSVNHVRGESEPDRVDASVESGSDEDRDGILAMVRCAMTQLDLRVGTMAVVGEKVVRVGTAKDDDRLEIIARLAG